MLRVLLVAFLSATVSSLAILDQKQVERTQCTPQPTTCDGIDCVPPVNMAACEGLAERVDCHCPAFASPSGGWCDCDPGSAFDGKSSTWYQNVVTIDAYLGVDFTTPRRIGKIKIISPEPKYLDGAKFIASNTSNWKSDSAVQLTYLAGGSNVLASKDAGWQTFEGFTPIFARYLFMVQHKCPTCTWNAYMPVGEFEVYEAPILLSGHGHGDPHLRNMQGEDFDVMQEGNMLLVETPRHSSPSTLDFALRANIERLGAAPCGPTYITSVDIEGRWVGDSIHIKAGKYEQTPKVQDRHAFAIRLLEGEWCSHAKYADDYGGYLELSSGAVVQTKDRAFVLKVKGLNIVVSQPKRPRVFLDVQIKGLETLQGEIGGLLGIDDHSEAEALPAECQ